MKKTTKLFSLILTVIMLMSVVMPAGISAQSTPLTGSIYAFDENNNQVTNIGSCKSITAGVLLNGTVPDGSTLYVAVYDGNRLVSVKTKEIFATFAYHEFSLTLPGTQTQSVKAFVWDVHNVPLTEIIRLTSNKAAVIENTEDIRPINTGKYDSVIGAENLSDYYLSVYNPDIDYINTVYNLDNNAQVYVNGKYLAPAYNSAVLANMHGINGATANLGKYYAPSAGKVTLLNTDNDNDYDLMSVKSYETVIVDEIYSNNTKISTKNTGVIDLDFENKIGYTYSLTMDGKAISIADLKEWDVLSVAVTDNKKNYEIIAERTTVEDIIGEIDGVNGIYIISGNEYEIANMADPYVANLSNATPGDEGIFYIDAFGKIAYFNRIISFNYGFITGANHYYYVGDNYYNIELLGKDGTITTYSLADNVKINANGIQRTDTAANVYNNYIDPMVYINEKWTLSTGDGTNANMLENYANRLVTYTVNNSGKISAISFAAVNGTKEGEFNYNKAYNAVGAKFYESVSAINNVGVTEDTVVFSLPIKANSTKDDFEVATIDILGDGDEYDVAFFNIDENGNAGAIIITNCDSVIGAGSSLAVVTEITQAINSNNEPVYNISFLQNGEEKTLTTTTNLYHIITSDGYACGDVFEYAVNTKGEMSYIAFGEVDDVMLNAGNIDTITPNATWYSGLDAEYDASATGNAPQYVFGAVYKKSTNGIIQIADIANACLGWSYRHKIPDDANITVIDLSRSTTSPLRVRTGSYEDILPMYFDKYGKIAEERDISVLLKYYKDEVTDVVVYLHYGELYAGMKVNSNISAPEYKEPEITNDMNYGFIMGASSLSPTGGVSYDIQILNRNGTVSIHSLADNVRINVNGVQRTDTAANVYNNFIAPMVYINGKWTLKEGDGTNANMLENYANRLVTYTVNNSGKISAISFADYYGFDVNNFNYNGYATGAEYKEQIEALGAVGVTKDTVVFSLPIKANSTKDDFEVATIDILGDGDTYDVAFFNIDEQGNAGAIIITNCDSVIGAGSSLAVVTKIMATKNSGGETVYNITFLQAGEEKTLTTTANLYNIIVAGNYTRSDVFEYAVNTKGEMSYIAFGEVDDVMLKADNIDTITPNATWYSGLDAEYDASATGSAPQYVFGGVYAKTSSRVIHIADFNGATLAGGSYRHKIPDDANITIVDLTRSTTSNFRVQLGAYGDIRPMYFDNNGHLDADRDTAVLLKYYKDEVTDVIIYKGYGCVEAGMSVIQ